MAVKRKIMNPMVRSTGQRVNHYGDASDNSRGYSDLEYTIAKIAKKVDTPTGQVEESQDTSDSGSFRVIKDKKVYYLEIKTDDGWIRSDGSGVSASGFVLRDKK
tara:strand:- start:212 stop:523 length:312 start_codon:yes stop_codon:yes gene_type:complete